MCVTYEQALAAISDHGDIQADDACRVFSKTLDWPEMEDCVRLEVCLRLECAAWSCSQFADFDAEPAEWSGSNLLTDLLIEYWHEGGRRDWLQAVLAHEIDLSPHRAAVWEAVNFTEEHTLTRREPYDSLSDD